MKVNINTTNTNADSIESESTSPGMHVMFWCITGGSYAGMGVGFLVGGVTDICYFGSKTVYETVEKRLTKQQAPEAKAEGA